MTAYAEYHAAHGHQCGPLGEITGYRRVDLDDGTILQVAVCVGCGDVVARRYVVSGPGSGPWTVLARGAGVAS